MNIKTPTLEDYQNYDGLHCNRLWASIGEDWACPSCNRSKFQILLWTTRFPGKPDAFEDWVALLHRHHDHSQGVWRTNPGRFPEMVICGQCNSADGAAKRMLGLPKDFSFSPSEIAMFITATPHGQHKIDPEAARKIYHLINT